MDDDDELGGIDDEEDEDLFKKIEDRRNELRKKRYLERKVRFLIMITT